MCVIIEEKFLAFEIVPFGSLEVFFFFSVSRAAFIY